MMTAPSWDPSIPAWARAPRAAVSARSSSEVSPSARRRVTMPVRFWIHSSEESIHWQMSSLETTTSPRAAPTPMIRVNSRAVFWVSTALTLVLVLYGGRTAVFVDEVAGGVQVLGGFQRQGRHALQPAAGQAHQGAGRRELEDPGHAHGGHGLHAPVPPDRPRDLGDQAGHVCFATGDGP